MKSPGHFGKLVQDMRNHRGLTQAELARTAGISLSTLQKIEAGPTSRMMSSTALSIATELRHWAPLSPEELEPYAAATGISPELLAGDSSTPRTTADDLVATTAARAFRGDPPPPREPTPAAGQLGESLRRLVAVTSVDYVRGVLDSAYIAATMAPRVPIPTDLPMSHLTPGVNQPRPHPPPFPGSVAMPHPTPGHIVTEYAPTNPPTSQPAAASPPRPKAKKLNG